MNPLPPISDAYERALRLAAVAHRGQERRGSGIPYVAHPFAVAGVVARAGFDEATQIAALLHDVVEDTDVTLDAIRREFGDEVAATVAGCSEEKRDAAGRDRPWEDRKHDYLAALRSASLATRAVVLADKLHNLTCIRLDLEAGRPIWAAFHAPRDRVLWYQAAAVAACDGADGRLRGLAEACRAEITRVAGIGENPDFAGRAT